jgi:hypothetical protein
VLGNSPALSQCCSHMHVRVRVLYYKYILAYHHQKGRDYCAQVLFCGMYSGGFEKKEEHERVPRRRYGALL